LYIDLDLKINDINRHLNDNNDLDICIKNFIFKINEYMKQKYNIDYDNNNAIVLTSTSEFKFSYHIIFQNYLFDSINDIKIEIELIKQSLYDDVIISSKMLDLTPYYSNN